MKHQRTLLLSALLLPPLVAWVAPSDEVAFGPSEGHELTKSFHTNGEMTLDKFAMMMNGNDFPMGQDMEMSVNVEYVVTVTDEYLSSSDGRPVSLKRSYDEIGAKQSISGSAPMMGLDGEFGSNAGSDLEGKTVLFSWDEEEGGFTASFADDDGDEDLLENLWEDMDLRSLLPTDAVSPEDSWELDIESLKTIFAPGGGLSLVSDETDGDDAMGMAAMTKDVPDPAEALGDLSGTATATYLGLREEGDIEVAEIRVEFDVTSTADLSEKIAEQMEDLDIPFEMEIEYMDTEWEFDGEGVLLWNISEGVFYSFEVSGTQSVIQDQGMTVSGTPQGDIELEQTLEFSGSYSLTCSVE